ncbi:cytochrome P450 [Kitasatospora sp. NPDC052896]|uniref:cytochrome P450 n=1 Tax=Kitasatospora sp. NPDC052896 TaxID=3364061 RepID=UPI0037C6FFD6
MDPESLLFSIFSPAGREDPYHALAELRRIEPVHHSKTLDTYCLTRFTDCQSVLTDPRFLAPDLDWCERELPDWREHPAADFFYSSMLRSNGSVHGRLRRLVAGAFSARRVTALRARVEEITTGLLDRFADATAAGGVADFPELVGYPLPVAVIGELIGVPPADQARFHRLGQDASRLLEPVRTAEDWHGADRAVLALREYLTVLLRERRLRPADDLTSALLAASDAEDLPLTEAELTDTLLLTFVAGFETTTAMLGLTVFALLSHPEQLELVRAQPQLAGAAVEESLRWDTPVQMTERVAAEPVEVGGTRIPQGANVTTVLAAANRDPRRHPDPDSFTVRRPDTRVLSFSAGPHYCLGAALARIEGVALVGQLLSRFPRLALARPPVRRASISLRSLKELALLTNG